MNVDEEPITTGKLVKLRTGNGPDMVVESLTNGFAVCIWFDEHGNKQGCTFGLLSLYVPKFTFIENGDGLIKYEVMPDGTLKEIYRRNPSLPATKTVDPFGPEDLSPVPVQANPLAPISEISSEGHK